MTLRLLASAAALLALSACGKDDDSGADGGAGASGPPPLTLTDAAPGQRALYERYALAADDTVGVAQPDTLAVTVVESDSPGRVTVEETVTAHSWSRRGGGPAAVGFAADTVRYRLELGAAGLTYTPLVGESRLFASVEGGALTLAFATHPELAAELRADRVASEYLPVDRTVRLRNDAAAVAGLRHGYRDRGLPGFTYVYDREAGLRRSLVEYDLAGNAEGWRRIR